MRPYHGPCREAPCPNRCAGHHGWCKPHASNRLRGRRPQHEARTGRPPAYEGEPQHKGRRRQPAQPDERWTLWVYNRAGDYMERLTGDEQELREQGMRLTMLRGQLGWRCSLRRNGQAVAECKRGVWKDVPGLEAKP